MNPEARTQTLFRLVPPLDGPCFDPVLGQPRPTKQLARVFDLMKGGQWRTLHDVRDASGAPPASVSAQLRHLRKPWFESYRVDKRRGLGRIGLWEYRLSV